MEYKKILEKVKALNFVPDQKTADSMIKSVLGHFASRMKEAQAKQFTQDLPAPLDYDILRGHQVNITSISLDQFISDIQSEFTLDYDETQSLIRAVFHIVKSETPEERVQLWEQGLPKEWAAVIKNA